jgi:hypothetical protein
VRFRVSTAPQPSLLFSFLFTTKQQTLTGHHPLWFPLVYVGLLSKRMMFCVFESVKSLRVASSAQAWIPTRTSIPFVCFLPVDLAVHACPPNHTTTPLYHFVNIFCVLPLVRVRTHTHRRASRAGLAFPVPVNVREGHFTWQELGSLLRTLGFKRTLFQENESVSKIGGRSSVAQFPLKVCNSAASCVPKPLACRALHTNNRVAAAINCRAGTLLAG